MSEIRTIGKGTVRGFQWSMEAGGDDEGYWTGLRVAGPGDYRCSGGMAGPKLWGDDLINVYTGRSDDGPLGIVVRAAPQVSGVVVRTIIGQESDLPRAVPDVVDGLRFFVGLAWPLSPPGQFGLDQLRALDRDGAELASSDLSFWDRHAS